MVELVLQLVQGTIFRYWKRRDDGSPEMDGYMDDVRIYSRALSAADIAQLYNFRSPTLRRPQNNLGLVGYWSFNEGTSTVAQDYSGSGYNSTLQNGARWSSGKLGKGITFDGSDDYMELPAGVFGNYPTAGSTNNYYLTFSTWFKTTSTGVILGQTDGTSPPSAVTSFVPALYVDTSGYLRSSFIWHNSSGVQIVSSVDYRDNRWHHVVVTYGPGDAGDEKLFVDGIRVGRQFPLQYGYSATYKYFLGAGYGSTWTDPPSSGWGYFNGILDETRIYNRTLTDSEIKVLYGKGAATVGGGEKLKVTDGLIGHWTFNGNDMNWTSQTAGTAYDRSGKGNDGTLTNMDQLVAPVAGKVGQGLFLNGPAYNSNVYVSVADTAALKLQGGELTFSLWVKPVVNNWAAQYTSLVSSKERLMLL